MTSPTQPTQPVQPVQPVQPAQHASQVKEFAIESMRRRHLRGVLAIEELSNHKPWSLGLFLGELKMPTSRFYQVALDRHRVLGFSGLMFTDDEGHVTNIAVHPDARRSGIATQLMLGTMREAISRGLTQVTLEVRVTNAHAQELYRHFGFAPGGVRRNYYREIGEDALIMWANDIDTPDYAARLDRIPVSRSARSTESWVDSRSEGVSHG